MFSVSMPKRSTSFAFVETATKCFATASSPSAFVSQRRALSAFVIVSCVVKVFDATMKSVRRGSSRDRVWTRCAPSTFETKCGLRSGRWNGFSASQTMSGPRSEPPMPMLTTSVIVSPLAPRHSPLRTLSEKRPIRSRTSRTPGITSSPPMRMGRPERLRSATCRTARFSVALIVSPANMRSRHSSTFAARARSNRSRKVSSSTRFFE